MRSLYPDGMLWHGSRYVRRGLELMRRHYKDYDVLLRNVYMDVTCASARYLMAGNRLLGPFAANVLAQALIGGRRFGAAEEARENELQHNCAMDESYWTKVYNDVTANVITDPEGNLTADRIVPTTDSEVHQVKRNGHAVDGSSTYAFSAFVKGSAYVNGVQHYFGGSAFPGTPYIQVNTLTGEILDQADCDSYGVVPLINGWFFIYITATSDAAVNTYPRWDAMHDGTTSFAGTGDNADCFTVWGAQLEKGAFPSSLIKTGASSVTRAKTEAYWPAAVVPAVMRNGKWAVDIIPFWDSDTPRPANSRIAVLRDDTLSRRVEIWHTASEAFQVYYYNGGSGALITTSAVTWAAYQRITLVLDAAAGTLTVIGATTGDGVYSGTPWDDFLSEARVYWGSGNNFPVTQYFNGLTSEPYRKAA